MSLDWHLEVRKRDRKKLLQCIYLNNTIVHYCFFFSWFGLCANCFLNYRFPCAQPWPSSPLVSADKEKRTKSVC